MSIQYKTKNITLYKLGFLSIVQLLVGIIFLFILKHYLYQTLVSAKGIILLASLLGFIISVIIFYTKKIKFKSEFLAKIYFISSSFFYGLGLAFLFSLSIFNLEDRHLKLKVQFEIFGLRQMEEVGLKLNIKEKSERFLAMKISL